MIPRWETSVDVVVVGSGVAGLVCALDAASLGLSVLIVTKAGPADGSTALAQGGIAVADAPGDTVPAHVADTLAAGAGLCEPAAVRSILADGPRAVRRLIGRGASFDAIAGQLLRTREGGHSTERIVHAGGDATGAEVERTLLADPSLPALLSDHQAVDVALGERGAVAGVYLLDPDNAIALVRADAVVLATGGAGQLFAASTNPAVATADGIAMAARAGADLSDLEFVQFHPTALWRTAGQRGQRPLITEALRGAGAVLIDGAGRRVLAGVHPLADLAPRDVVALAITRRLRERPGGIGDHVFLDCGAVDGVAARFPSVTASCRAIGIEPGRQLIPVSPAAHYLCGGVVTDLTGATTVPGLFAVGETARTGLHGANRLASNSLLEGLVLGRRAAVAVARRRAWAAGAAPPLPLAPQCWSAIDQIPDLQDAMSQHAGVGREPVGLRRARTVAEKVLADRAPLSRATVEATNLAQVSVLLLDAAEARSESRGCHVRLDAPVVDQTQARPIVLRWIDGQSVIGGGVRRERPVVLAG